MSRFRTYLGEVYIELKKANWPWDPKEKGFAKYKELIDSTIVVFIAMILLGAFVAFFDTALRGAFDALAKSVAG
ncbi:MAG: preprotein translocase subunit SecE [Verrucomicrobiota bacterium]|jgi:preprotein translocase subunit SecE|uniref:Preprotein translocase subunit SecE n=1 Tax=Prosthecobacter algae TaxID=1144682 RepID=A0ABP9PHA1_9BACT|nr:preprotein translocase subunit SecE [Verrucomicrobiales bacterium]